MTGGQLDLIDGHGLAEQVARRNAVAELAAAVMDETERTNTTRAFRDDWNTWLAFCEVSTKAGAEVLPLEISSDALVIYARWLGKGGLMPDGTSRTPSAPETIRRRLTGVLYGWRENGCAYPRGVSGKAREWVRDYERKLVEANAQVGRGQAPALTVRDARKIAETTPPDLAGRRDLALVLIGFAIAGRRSELAHLQVSDIAPDERGLYVHVRFSKTKPRRPAVLFGQNDATCPVKAWRRWQAASGIVTGAAFRRIDRHGNLGGQMSGEAVGAVITRAGQRAGLDLRLTGHSVRSGLATEARRAGHDPATIADQGGWQRDSAALHRYIRIVDQWTDNALAGIGL